MTSPVFLPPAGSKTLQQTLDYLLQNLDWDKTRAKRVSDKAERMIASIRASEGTSTEIETFLQYYTLDSAEGRALMTLAESLLRIPDPETADLLIGEKLGASDWKKLEGTGLMMKAAGLGLDLARSSLNIDGLIGNLVGTMGRPVIRKATQEIVKKLGGQFVLGQTIEDALRQGDKLMKQSGLRCSFDMLGEGARTMEDADRYFAAYKEALEKIGAAADPDKQLETRHGMSVKLSALHPRYHWPHTKDCVPFIAARLLELADLAAQKNITLTVDAEESERLELSLEIVSQVVKSQQKTDWRGLGMAVQAYDRRCLDAIDFIGNLAKTHDRTMQIRLVKGAYWDGEIKRAQIGGWPDYPVFQRKSQTDLSYLAAAQKMLGWNSHIFPMFATHNAHTAAAILDFLDGKKDGFEFQRLHGMGSSLGHLLRNQENAPVTIYAPVGPYQDLLPYLVRRMLENGANVSFVAKLRQKGTDPSDLAADPVEKVKAEIAPEPLPKPLHLYGENRRNSRGFDLSSAQIRQEFFAAIPEPVPFPLQQQPAIEDTFDKAKAAFPLWNDTPADTRADILEKAADLIEKNTPKLMALLQDEAKRTFADALSEIREAADFCRYYAALGRRDFAKAGQKLLGPTGEDNHLRLSGRGVFVCISPWNFPLAIFTGQIAAALMAGNSVIAKPAEQTPQISAFAVSMLHKAGVPEHALIMIAGDGETGAELVAHKDVAGVAFTGSTAAARSINRTLAAKSGPIVPIIAETGGQNAMIVDSTALLEQVVDDVMSSAFGSAGQRCSALRILYLQDDIADKIIHLLQGAMKQLKVGFARDAETDIGEVIDKEAQKNLLDHIAYLESFAKKLAVCDLPEHAGQGCFVAPCAYEIDSLSRLEGEVFGPVLHVIRYKAKDLDKVIEDINKTGFGLTFGLQSRLESRFRELAGKIRAGNVYINRSMIGAVVGVQPFGGQGLSGTGPKAGGPHYLHRFAAEQTISDNIMALGGNIGLISRDLG